MWLEHEKFREIDHAVVKGERRGLSRLLAELFHPENQKYPKDPTRCPKCQKTLVKKMDSYLEYFVQACPDRHGAWMSPEVSAKLQQFVNEQILLAHKKKQALQFFGILAVVLLFFSFANRGTDWLSETFFHPDMKISEKYWPDRDFRIFPDFPIKESKINSPEELLYLTQLLKLLEDGASNRINMDAVLKTRRSEEAYWKAFQHYELKHAEFMSRFRLLSVPEGLKPFHQKIETAAMAQLEFYGAFTQEKIGNPSLDLDGMLHHPALQTSNRELLSAFDSFKQYYPELDTQSQQAVEGRICWFDVV